MTGRKGKTPDIAQIEELLQSTRLEPGARFHQQMAGAPWKAASTQKEGVFKMNGKYRFAAFVAVVLVLITVLFVTPAGSVLANQVAHFFTRAQSNALPLPSDQIQPPVPSATPEPTHALALQPASQVATTAPTATLVPTPVFNPDELQDLSLAEAEAAVGFKLYQPSSLPRDYRLTRILYDPKHQTVSLQYTSPQTGTGEFFQVMEGKNLEPLSVGSDAQIETVDVGGASAEFVQGAWFIANGASEKTWESETGTYTLRWREGDVTISIQFFLNESFSPAYLEKDEMLAVARSITQEAAGSEIPLVAAGEQPGAAPATNQPDLFTSIPDLEARAGFDVLEPGLLPEGLAFSHARYNSSFGSVSLFYGSFAPDRIHADGPVLVVIQAPLTRTGGGPTIEYPPGAIQTIKINGYLGQLMQGSIETFMAEPGQPTPEPVWHANDGTFNLSWETDEASLTIHFGPAGKGGRITLEELLQIAESLH